MNEQKPDHDISEHKRVNDILLGPLERPAIQWLVEHMPAWVTPDHLTVIGLIAALVIGVSYWATRYSPNYLWLASFGFILNWVGDSLDGNLARYRKIERPKYGFYVDHIVDTISEITIFLGLGLSQYVDFNLAVMGLIGYLCMTIQVYLTTNLRGVFKISYGKLGPTEIRAIAILANTFIFFIGNPAIKLPFGVGEVGLYNLIVGTVVVLLYVIFMITVFQEARLLDKEDRMKWKSK
ncbi:MAG TPA: CDP-alcohol phosphatidyltransferase family protein [Anaerolineaceae bacterium]|nr:CDP-alcohol phosphatidyltransferase family protein [Anaerolineaceae bacterium]